MSFIVADRCKETSSTTGTGAFTLTGAPTNYVSFNTGVGVGNVTWYAINNLNANEWEVGLGTLTASTTLTRTTIINGTNGTAAVNFSAGTKEVFVTLPSAFNAQTLGRTNVIINPHGSIQQETTTPVTATSTYFADQWLAGFAASGGAFQAGVTTGTVSSFDPSYMFYQTTTAKASLAAGDFATIVQRIEGGYTRRFLFGGANAKGSWLRWRASCTQSATCSVAIQNGAGNRSFVQSFAVTTTPTDFFLFVPGDTTGTWATDNTVGATVNFCFAAGTTFQTSTLGAWQAGNLLAANTQTNLLGTLNAQLNITDVQWSSSQVVLPFEPIDYEQELARCQRYYIKLAGFTASASRIMVTQAFSTTQCEGAIYLPVYMRSTVTPTLSGNTDFLCQNSTGSTVQTTAVLPINGSGNVAAARFTVASGLVSGNAVAILTQNSGAFITASSRM